MIRRFVLFEATCFAVAALIHAGFLIPGYEHSRARIAETVLATVLFIGAALTWIRPGSTRRVGIAVQGFALLGTLVGVLTIIIGVGPRTLPDVIYHIGIVGVLAWGLIRARETAVG